MALGKRITVSLLLIISGIESERISPWPITKYNEEFVEAALTALCIVDIYASRPYSQKPGTQSLFIISKKMLKNHSSFRDAINESAWAMASSMSWTNLSTLA